MAMAMESLCHKDPNFAVICNFWDRYGDMIGLKEISYSDLERWLEDTKQVPMPLIDLHVRLLRRIGKTSVTANRWERYIIKFCYTYSDLDAWEMEKFGYKHCKLATKLKLLKNLLEKQFDQNSTFKEKINKLAPEDMRFQPIGRDKNGLAYWYMLDNECNLRVYREDLDDNDAETWEIVCKTRSDLAELVAELEKQIKGTTEVKTESSSSSNSVKSEVVDDDKNLGSSDDSQDSLPEVKKDPEKTKTKEEKLDEVDGIVNKKENDEKKDINIKKEDTEEKKDCKVENRDFDEKKDSTTSSGEKKGGNADTEDTKHIKVENVKCEPVEETGKTINLGVTAESTNIGATAKDCKTKDESKHVENDKCEIVLKTESTAEDSSLDHCESKHKSNEGTLEESDGKEKLTDLTKNIPGTDDRVKGQDSGLVDDKTLNSQNEDKKDSVKPETGQGDINEEKRKVSSDLEKISEKIHVSDSNESLDNSSNRTSENSLEMENTVIVENESSAKSETVSSTSDKTGATCDKDHKNSMDDTKCGCDNNQQIKGDNQSIKIDISNLNKDIDNKLETNLRKSSRLRTSRTRSQDSQLKEDKDDTKLIDSKQNNAWESNKNDSSQTLYNSDLEKENNKTPVKSKSKVKGKKRPLLFEDNSTEDSPTVEPESKKSKPAKKILTKKTPTKAESSSEDTDDSEDIPLSQIKGTPKSSGKKTPQRTPKSVSKGKKGKKAEPTPTRKSSRPVKKKKFDSDKEEEALPKSKKAKSKTESSSKKSKSKLTVESDDENTPLKTMKKIEATEEEEEEEEEDNEGRRRSSRVKKLLKAKKKEPSPPLSSFEEEEDDDHSDFTVDTDLDDSDDEYNPAPKGRNAQRQAAIQDEQEKTDEIPNDTPCLHCHKTDRPEWLLLCDKCDDGYHTACLRPPLMIIPDGDWFCPPCEHKGLLEKLQTSLKDLDIIMKKKDRLIKRKERLAYVGISLDNILKDEQKENVNPDNYDEYSGDEEEEYYKPKPKKSFVKRTCRSRNVISYKFDEFDDMINTAIKDDLENPQPYNPGKGRSRGKDMANIYMAEGREYVSEEEGKPSPVGGRRKKKGRRLTNLDDDDVEDEDSGEEYKCSDDSVSEPPEEEEEDDDNDISDYSVDGEGWRARGSRRSARRNKSSRRYRDFVVDEDEDSDFAPRRKSARAARAATRQRRKHKEVWSDEEEEEEEEESDESIDTEDLCSEDSGPTKKKKNRKEIDKKVFKKDKKNKHGAKRRRVVDSDEESEGSDKSSGDGEESESKSESDDSSIDMGKIKKAAKRKLSKRRYSESSSESEKSEFSGPSHRERKTTKKVNYRAIAGSDSDATEESEEKSESENETKLKKKNVIRDDSSDTDDYHGKQSEKSESDGDTTEEDEKEPVKPKKPKKDEKEEMKVKKSETEVEDKEENEDGSKVKTGSDIKNEVVKGEDKNQKQDTETENITSVPLSQTPDINTKTDQGPPLQEENNTQNVTTPENSALQMSDTAALNTMSQNNTGVIKPSPLYSVGQNIPERNYPTHQGPPFQGHSTPYGSPPQHQYMSSPPHQPYPNQQMGGMMPPRPTHSQPFPPQIMQRNFPISSSGAPLSTHPGSVSSPPFQQMQQRPQYTSGIPMSPNQAQMYGRFPQGQPMLHGKHPDHHDETVMQKGPRPEVPGHIRSPFQNQQDGQMFQGPYPGQQQMMRGPYPNQQDMMIMQNRHPNYQQNQMMRGPSPSQQGQSHIMRSPYSNSNQEDLPRVQQNMPESSNKGPQTDKQEGDAKVSDGAISSQGQTEKPIIQGQHSAFESRQARGSMPFPRQGHRPILRGPFPTQQDGHPYRGQDGMFRPGFPFPDHQMPSSHQNEPGYMNKQLQPGPQMALSNVSSSHLQNPNISSQAFMNRPSNTMGQSIPSQMPGRQMAGPRISSPPAMDTRQQTFPNRQTNPGLQSSPMPGPNVSRPEISSPPVKVSQEKDQKSVIQTSQSMNKESENLLTKSIDQKQTQSGGNPPSTEIDPPESKTFTESKIKKEKQKDEGIPSSSQGSDEIHINKKVTKTVVNDGEKALEKDSGTNKTKETYVRSSENIKSDGDTVTDLLQKEGKEVCKISTYIKPDVISKEGTESKPGPVLSKVPSSEDPLMQQRSPGVKSPESIQKEHTGTTPGPIPLRMISSEGPRHIQQSGPNPQSLPPTNCPDGSMQEPSVSRSESSMVSGPHPYQQGMFQGQFNEIMSQMGQNNSQRMHYQQGGIGMPPRPNMQGPQNFYGPGPRNYMPRMGPNGIGQMPQHFQRPMYGPGPIPYSQSHGMPNAYGPGPRPEIGMRMPQNFGPEDQRPGSLNKAKMQDISGDQNQTATEPTKAKKPRKPRQSKQQKEKLQSEAKTTVSTGPNYPGYPQQPANIGQNPQLQMPMHRPMNPQQGQFMRPPFDSYGLNGMNQGPPEYNQMNPGMYGPPQMMPPNGGRGFMIDNLLDKPPRVQQLEPIISQDDDEENSVEQEHPPTYEEEESPSNGEKDMDEMSDIGDIVKYVMNH